MQTTGTCTHLVFVFINPVNKEILYSWKFLSTPIFEDFEVFGKFSSFFCHKSKAKESS